MPIRQFTLPSIPEVYNGSRKDHFIIGDGLMDFHNLCVSKNVWHGSGEWTNRMSSDTALECVKRGHLPSVAPSDKFLTMVENILPAPTAKHEWTDDVQGAIPNVPAFLSGHPMNMRRKIKRENEAAPIAVVVDAVLSGGIDNDDLEKRGAAVLALVRALSSRRPVELYIGGGLQADSVDAQWFFWRVDTAPLDLARAAFMLVHAAPTRGLLYGLGRKMHNFHGAWPYADYETGRILGDKIVRRAFPHMSDMIFVPGAFMTDESIKNPVEWVRKNVAAHVGED